MDFKQMFKKHEIYLFGYGSLMYPRGINGRGARWVNWEDLQVEGANRALAISHAGVGSHVTATIVVNPDHRLDK